MTSACKGLRLSSMRPGANVLDLSMLSFLPIVFDILLLYCDVSCNFRLLWILARILLSPKFDLPTVVGLMSSFDESAFA